ncbi:acyltransferase [Bacillus sp. ISL-47]|uniref:acyltransferase family protein n=1 Tax=Bacillus sp. ISL-47 TaxID=2819130 RepID=UPI001BE6319D|nr:acyltransferase [Bacillus sp. ISL-47]MBT2689228.1 acyltransferase [Bacillus sp. ISL-47]MBT2708651.1 acyltransferase [Pseudomonas sp. ISL-84]
MKEIQIKFSLIQVFRGIAALLVLIHHGAYTGEEYLNYEYLNGIFKVGWIGVDFFFILSGFIIYYVHSKDIGIKTKMKTFILKRFIRVYPIYGIMTTFLLFLFFIVPNWGVGYETSIDVIIKSFLLFPQEHAPIISVGWTLEHEIFFYIMFSLLIFLKPKYSVVIASMWIIGIVSNSVGIINLEKKIFLNFVFSNYNLEFIFGCIVGYIFLNYKVKYNKSLILMGIIGFISGWYFVYQDDLIRYTTLAILVFGISFSLIVLATVNVEKSNKIKVPKFLLVLGDASYSIYLTHFYILLLLFKVLSKLESINPFNDFITITCTFIIAIILGVMFHIVIEKPLINFLNKNILKQRPPLKSGSATKVA